MRIAIFGGTGRTGQHLVEQALAAGHQVTLLARNAGKVKTQHPNLNVLKGSIQDITQVEEALNGVEAVISVLGPTQNKPIYEISVGMDNIIAAMHKHHVKRLIVSAGAGVSDPHDSPGPFDRFIKLMLKLFSRHVYQDMVQVVSKVRTSELDWTIVRVPMLVDRPATGDVKVGYVGQGTGSRIGRADMASFMLKQLTDNSYLHQAPAISN